MRVFLALIGIVAALAGCSTGDHLLVSRAGALTVYVHVGPEGLEGKAVEILQTGESALTDSRGIARFVLAPGAYTVRVREITGPGPGLGYVDTAVEIASGKTTEIDVEDCPACAGA